MSGCDRDEGRQSHKKSHMAGVNKKLFLKILKFPYCPPIFVLEIVPSLARDFSIFLEKHTNI